jgi:hypothetical protein
MRAVVLGVIPEHQVIVALGKALGKVIPVAAREDDTVPLHCLFDHRVCEINGIGLCFQFPVPSLWFNQNSPLLFVNRLTLSKPDFAITTFFPVQSHSVGFEP